MHFLQRLNVLVSQRGVNSLPRRAPQTLSSQLRTTTILCIRKGSEVVMMGDKRVTLGQSVIAKDSARKLRRAGSDSAAESDKASVTEPKVDKYSDPGTVLVGFAGSTADAMTLLEKLEAKLNEFPSQLLRASVELAKEWRGDKMLRRLEASMIVADINETLEIDGSGNVLTPDSSSGSDEGIVAIGSGGQYAKSAARGLMKFVKLDEADRKETKWTSEMICRAAMEVAASIDVFTSKEFDVDRLVIPPPPEISARTDASSSTEAAEAIDSTGAEGSQKNVDVKTRTARVKPTSKAGAGQPKKKNDK